MTTNELFEESQAFALWVANKYRTFENIEDLKQLALIGLFRATKTFDESRGIKFVTYAYPFIWREIFSFIEKSNSVHIPRHIIEHSRAIKRLDYENMSVAEIAVHSGLNEKQVNQALHYMALRIASTDEYVHADESMTVGETIASVENDWDELITIKDFMQTLDDKEKLIMNMRINDCSQAEIGKALNISQVHASRLLKKIKGKFEKFIA